MKSVKHMTKTQLLRIQSNNYCSEHDKYGNQFDYEARGYREEIDARLWELSNKKVNDMIKQARTIHTVKPYTVKQSASLSMVADKAISAPISKKPLVEPNNALKSEIDKLDIQLSVMRAFKPWRFIGNELVMNYGIDK